MFKVLLPGSFDPPTWGHIRLIRRAARICDVLLVGIGENEQKGKSILTLEEKVEGLKKEFEDLPNIEIVGYFGLTTDFAKENGVKFLVRGLRTQIDMEYEKQIAHANLQISGIETLFMIAEGDTAATSSTLIRELAANRAPLKDFVPKYFEKLLYDRIPKR